MKRKRLSFVPCFKGPIEGYVVNFLKRNYWKVAAHHEFEDLLQEAYFKFLVVKEKYPEVIDPPHFMALFKTSWKNHFTVLAAKQAGDLSIIESDLLGVRTLQQIQEKHGKAAAYNGGPLAVLISTAPIAVKALLNAHNDPTKISLLREKFRKVRHSNKKARRETTDEKLRRITGLRGYSASIRSMTINHFS